jgi:hypothetical protein
MYGILGVICNVPIEMEHCEFFYVMDALTKCTLVPANNPNVKGVLDGCDAVQCARLNNPLWNGWTLISTQSR